MAKVEDDWEIIDVNPPTRKQAGKTTTATTMSTKDEPQKSSQPAIDDLPEEEDKEVVIKVEIVGTKKMSDKSKKDKKYVQYVLHVETEIPGVSWNVGRRYNQFVLLHTELKKIFRGPNEVPSLPSKHIIRTTTSEDIEKRRSELNRYLGQLVKNREVARSEPWCSFLVGTFHDIFQRLKGFALKCDQVSKNALAAEQQRLTAVAQLQSERRRVEELRATVNENERKKKEADDALSIQKAAEDKRSAELSNAQQSVKKIHEQHLQELRDCTAKWQAKVKTLEDHIYKLDVSHTELGKQNATLAGEVTTLKQQKKLLVKGIKDLRDSTKQQPTSPAVSSAPVSANTITSPISSTAVPSGVQPPLSLSATAGAKS